MSYILRVTYFILLTFIIRFSWSGVHGWRQRYDIHQVCKNTSLGTYSRDFFWLRCCKQRSLEEPEGLQLHRTDQWNCTESVIRDNPDDELATVMVLRHKFRWKIKACRIQKLMGVSEDKINFKSVVDFLIRNYTNENDVNTLIQNANVECLDGDKETNTFAKLHHYLNCFYENEQKICEEKSDNSTAYKENFLKTYNISTTVSTGCQSIPGIWEQTSFCCNGHSTPDSWMQFSHLKYLKNGVRNYTSSSSCLVAVHRFRSANGIGYSNLPPNPTEEDFKKHFDVEFSFNCMDSCDLNPVIFKNDSSNPSINWDLDIAVDKVIAAYPLKLQKDIKAYVLKHKPTARIPITQADAVNKIGLNLKTIEEQYSITDDKVEKLKFYCSYYRGLHQLTWYAFSNHCMSKIITEPLPEITE